MQISAVRYKLARDLALIGLCDGIFGARGGSGVAKKEILSIAGWQKLDCLLR